MSQFEWGDVAGELGQAGGSTIGPHPRRKCGCAQNQHQSVDAAVHKPAIAGDNSKCSVDNLWTTESCRERCSHAIAQATPEQ